MAAFLVPILPLAADGGRGKKSGLREYARVVGKPFQNIAIYKDAAKVSYQCDTLVVAQLLDKARHLAAIPPINFGGCPPKLAAWQD
jgi:hypothetical protein